MAVRLSPALPVLSPFQLQPWQMQLVIIISDGRRSPGWGDPALWVRKATEAHILLCFVIIDAAASADSIFELNSVTYPNGRLVISR